MDQANVVVCLGRVIRELNRSEGARADAEGLAWELLQAGEQRLASTGSAHTLANLAWSLARLDGLIGPALCRDDGGIECDLRGLARLVVQRALDVGLETFAGRDAAVLLWAAATLHRKDPGVLRPEQRSGAFKALASGVGLALPEVAPQGLAMLLWALAVLDNLGTATSVGSGPTTATPVPRTLFKVVAEAAGQSVSSLSAREVANVAWSFATVQVQMPRWLLAEVPQRAAEFRAQECANVLWAYASASEPMEVVVSALPCTDPGFLESWKPQEMANAAWALAYSQGLPSRRAQEQMQRRGRALASMHVAIVDRVNKLNGLELAMVARTLGSNEAVSSVFLAEVAVRAVTLLEEGALAPDAVVQAADGITAAGGELPEPLAEARARLYEQAHSLLQRVADGSVHEVLGEIQGMGLTTVGARSTERLLGSLGLAGTGDREPGARPPWPEALEAATQVLCMAEYRLLFSGSRSGRAEREHRTVSGSARVFSSGAEPDARGLGLLAPVALRFSRDRDAEFLALTAVVAAARAAAAETGAETWDLRGPLRLHVSHTPCLSCVGAMLQFRRAFPAVRLSVSFDSHDAVE